MPPLQLGIAVFMFPESRVLCRHLWFISLEKMEKKALLSWLLFAHSSIVVQIIFYLTLCVFSGLASSFSLLNMWTLGLVGDHLFLY